MFSSAAGEGARVYYRPSQQHVFWEASCPYVTSVLFLVFEGGKGLSFQCFVVSCVLNMSFLWPSGFSLMSVCKGTHYSLVMLL